MEDLTLAQQRAFAVAPKFTSMISFLSSAYIVRDVLKSPQKRSRMYYRLMLAMNLHMMLQSIWYFWGTWAVPEGTAGFVGARGTRNTCTAQGFLIQLGFTVPFYYASLSLYSFVAVRNDFREERFNKIEPFIHMVVPLFPLASAIVMIDKQVINPNATWCWLESNPMFCGEEGEPHCIRGGEDEPLLTWLLVALPMFGFIFFSILMMVLLYWTVRRREKQIEQKIGKQKYLARVRIRRSKVVRKQASLYLAALILTYALSTASRIMQNRSREVDFSTLLAGKIMLSLQGLLILIVYALLKVSQSRDATASHTERLPSISPHSALTRRSDGQIVLDPEKVKRRKNRRLSRLSERSNFSIFDGTNPSDKYADFFIYMGSDDEEGDEEEEGRDDHEYRTDSPQENIIIEEDKAIRDKFIDDQVSVSTSKDGTNDITHKGTHVVQFVDNNYSHQPRDE